MPEIRECIAHYLCMLWFFQFCLEQKLDLQVLALWADASEKEEKKLAPNGLVYRLDASSTVARGSRNAQTTLWPGPLQKTRKNPNPPSIQTLGLKGVTYSNRTIILDMGPLHFQLAYLTHTSIQFFSKETWENEVTKTHKKARKYYIGLAFEFHDHVVAFLSQDQVFQPHWACSQKELPGGPIDVYTSYEQFLSNVADWIRTRANSSSDRLGLACEVMRVNGNKVWGGVGVYTSPEIFHDSGTSPFLTEKEVFDSPSRTARLCEALWSYAHKSHSEKMRNLLSPCVVNGIIAPTREQRMRYIKWLHVYAKDFTKLTPRMSKLVNNYETKLKYEESTEIPWFRDTADLVDFFEPNYIVPSLTKKSRNLGALIFGKEEWLRLRSTVPAEMMDLAMAEPASEDPLTAMFRERGLLSSPTNLPVYDTLFEQLDDHRKRIPHKTYTYRSAKQIWSIVRAFPENSWVSEGLYARSRPERITDSTRQKMLFKHIVRNTDSVAIGPLEYCGNGLTIRSSHRVKLVSAVRKGRDEILAEAASARLGHHVADISEEEIDDPPPPDVIEDDSDAEDRNIDILFSDSNTAFDFSSSDESDLSPPPSEPLSVASSDMDFSDLSNAEDRSANSSDNDLAHPPRKKKKIHVTADREMVLVGSSLETNVEPDSENRRGRRSRKPVNYARPRRKYTSGVRTRTEVDHA